jgi:hypothetical protein
MFFNANRKKTLAGGMLAVAGLAVLSSVPAAAQGYGRPSGPPAGGASATLTLSATEAKALAFMREEEKMARDLYRQLYAKWKLRVFDRISESEQRHFDAVGRLLTRFQLEDPARGLSDGIFTDPGLQALYNELLAKGERSAKDALEVGVLVEKTDIEDLEAALKSVTNTEVKRVFTSLLQASMNHLDTFESFIEILNQ